MNNDKAVSLKRNKLSKFTYKYLNLTSLMKPFVWIEESIIYKKFFIY